MIDELTRERCRPYPELLEGSAAQPYTIIDSQELSWLPSSGITDKVNHIICTPWHPLARDVARHELAHVEWSPETLPEFPHDTRVLQAVEDARINLGLARIGIPVELDESDIPALRDLVLEDAKRRDRAMLMLRAIASIGTNVESTILDFVKSRSRRNHRLAARLVERVRTRLEEARSPAEPVAPVAAMVEVARMVAVELGLLQKKARGAMIVGCCFGSGHGSSTELSAALLRRLGMTPSDMFDLAAALRLGEGTGRAGTMKISEPALVHSCLEPQRLRASRWRAAEEGSVAVFLHRLPIDRKIYRRPSRRRGATVLIDTSASMSLKAADIDRIVREVTPAALVAIYSGREDKGELRIVARDGVRADEKDLQPFGGSNVVDQPALEWLARQPTPRIWMSDGNVTGVNDVSSPALTSRCRTICSNAGIRRVPNVSGVVSALRGTSS